MPSQKYFEVKSRLTENEPFDIEVPNGALIMNGWINERAQDWDEITRRPIGSYYWAITVTLLGDPAAKKQNRTFVALSQGSGSITLKDKQRLRFVVHFNKAEREGFSFGHGGYDLCEIVSD